MVMPLRSLDLLSNGASGDTHALLVAVVLARSSPVKSGPMVVAPALLPVASPMVARLTAPRVPTHHSILLAGGHGSEIVL